MKRMKIEDVDSVAVVTSHKQIDRERLGDSRQASEQHTMRPLARAVAPV